MSDELRKSKHQIAAEIVQRRADAYKAQLDEAALRFALDAVIEGLHSDEALLQWYSRAMNAERQLKDLQARLAAGTAAPAPKPPKM